MAIKRTIAALLLTSGLAVSAAALYTTSANAGAYPWYGCKAVDEEGAALVADALAVGGGDCQAFAGAPQTGPAVTAIIVAPIRGAAGKYWYYTCVVDAAGMLGHHTVKGTVCRKNEIAEEPLRLIVGEPDFNKAFSS